MSSSDLPSEGRLPGFGGATGWLNSPPLTPEDLRGRVTLVNFWTYTCINWLRQLPYVRAWAERYADRGLVVVGVHTPEFGFEHDQDNVVRAVRQRGITYPVALDNEYAIWSAFANHYWPALYVADRDGRIRHHYFGEGGYEESERILRGLVADPGEPGPGALQVEARGAEVAADWSNLRSGETYTGYSRAEYFASPGGLRPGQPHEYDVPPALQLNHWALAGDWVVGDEASTLLTAGGGVRHRFHARDVHVVMGPGSSDAPVRFRIQIDGEAPGDAGGGDVDRGGHGTVTEQRLHQLVRQHGAIADRTCEITFLDPGVQVYAFTFG